MPLHGLRAEEQEGRRIPIIALTANALKGEAEHCRAVGAFALGELCEAIEEEGKVGEIGALTVLLPRFETEMAVVEDYLDTL